MIASTPRVLPVLEPGAALETMGGEGDPPKLIDARNVEDATFRSHAVGEAVPAFRGFLDGTQRSWAVAWDGVVPLAGYRVAAAIRARVDRRLVRWGEPALRWGIAADFSRTPRQPWLRVFTADALIDTSHQESAEPPELVHPFQALERARSAVSSERERMERGLAVEWIGAEEGPLLLDGGISGADALAASHACVGVVKSHRTMYVTGAALATALALRAGERSSVFELSPRGHSSVQSWYLRLRSHRGRGALWGLVRVEVAVAGDPRARADEVSRWILAERLPLALPDPRWDTLVYPIRGSEDFMRALG